MHDAKIIGNCFLWCGILVLLLGLITCTPEIPICGALFVCTSAIIKSLISIFSKEQSEDTKEN